MRNVSHWFILLLFTGSLIIGKFWPTWEIGKQYPDGLFYSSISLCVGWPFLYNFYLKDRYNSRYGLSPVMFALLLFVLFVASLISW